MQAFSEVASRVILIGVVITAVVYKALSRWCKKNGENTARFVKEHQAVEEALTVALFVGGIGLVLSLALPASHLVVGVLY